MSSARGHRQLPLKARRLRQAEEQSGDPSGASTAPAAHHQLLIPMETIEMER